MWYDPLKQAWNENPVATMGTVALVATAAAKVLDAMSAAKGRRAYAKQVNYRTSRRR